MPLKRQARKQQLERMTRDAIVNEWHKATSTAGSGSTRSISELIDEILKKEFSKDASEKSKD
jgi:hypothetical protein